jgi:hypothetical protein
VAEQASLPVLGILSREDNRELRDAIRQTWAATDACIVPFLIDAPTRATSKEAEQFKDVVFLGSPYRGRAVRFGDKLFRWFCHAARAYPNAPWVGKSDDDVFADLDAVFKYIRPRLSPLLYGGRVHGSSTLAPTKSDRIDEAFVLVGMALVQRLVRRQYCLNSTSCGPAGLIDTNFGGTSLGLWLSAYNDVEVLPMNEHMVANMSRVVQSIPQKRSLLMD